ncbi:MAG TPA: methyltransferase domain-containing protein [Candidatus Limnocylindrales bacterium]|nr:methyltransferase domain-containing protein [Candidatus Limnocylindrales bacterium]
MSALNATIPPEADAAATTGRTPFDFYGPRVAASDLRSYRTKGPRQSTKALVSALVADGVTGATVLDIGGGVGVIGYELLDADAASVTNVEASAAYLAAAREESARRGLAGRVTLQLGDFTELVASIPPADIVTLDRVLNVYPDWERLGSMAAERAHHVLGIVVPRDTPMVRQVVVVMNVVLRLRRQPIRARVIQIEAIDRMARRAGLARTCSHAVGAWQVLAFRRIPGHA